MFRSWPFLTITVFGLGIGLGLAWKSGWIPIEMGAANTGALESNVSDADAASHTSAEGSDAIPDDPELFAEQSEPGSVPADPVQESTTIPRARQSSTGIVTAVQTQADEPEWAQPTSSTRIPRQPTEAVGPGASSHNTSREVRVASYQEPTSSKLDSGSREIDPVSPSAEELATIDEQIANEQYLAAHRTLSKLYWNHKESRSVIMPRLHRTSRMIFFEPRPHLVDAHVVQTNEQLRVIASNYQISWEYLAKLNRTDPRRLQVGQKLKVLKGPFAAVVDLNDFALTVHLQGYFVKRYEVGIGKDGSSPIGKFSVSNKVENPAYTGPDGKVVAGDDSSNPLGERWIDLGESYGIHGTIEPDSIGKAASRGCIRMREKDVIEVYDFLIKGSEVVIRK